MSEFEAKCHRITNMEKHPDADTLSTIKIYDYPVIVRTEDYKIGDLCGYISEDALVATDKPQFSFLSSKAKGNGYYRVRAMKLRGVFSCGLLVKADPEWQEGQDLTELLGVKKYEIEDDETGSSLNGGVSAPGGQMLKRPEWAPSKYDLESIRKYKDLFEDGEEVVITEKIHGQNMFSVYKDDQLWVSSRNFFKKEEGRGVFWQAAYKYNFGIELAEIPNMVVWGELYGNNKGMRYDCAVGDFNFRAFDVYSLDARRFLDYDDFKKLMDERSIPTVPEIYRGPWKPELVELAEGNTLLGDHHIREGIVIKPVKERFNFKTHRTVLKAVSRDYLIKKK